MVQKALYLMLAILLFGTAGIPVSAAEREDVRKVINLVTSMKMAYPETLTRNRARTERVWLERGGTTTGCIRIEDRRWCYEYISPEGNRAEMLRIRNEPSRGVYIGALYYYMVDFDLDGLVDVGSTTRIDALDLRDSVRMLGWKSHEHHEPYYRHASIGLLPFLSTEHIEITLPNKLFDYMGAALPVIATDVAPLRRIIDETGAGVLVPPGDAASLSNALISLAADP